VRSWNPVTLCGMCPQPKIQALAPVLASNASVTYGRREGLHFFTGTRASKRPQVKSWPIEVILHGSSDDCVQLKNCAHYRAPRLGSGDSSRLLLLC
jgi:hypothetical protein